MSKLDHAIAVVGMSCRFPGAPDPATLWRNLVAGVESVSFFSREELLAGGVDAELLADPRYVPAKAVVEGEDLFDAPFFGLSPREAEILDPQHRVFLEAAWEALEDAAVDPSRFPGLIAVYAGVGSSSYAWNVLSRNPALVRALGTFQVAMSNDKDYLPTLVSYKLDLKGPSFAVQSACSTSLVAIHLACQSLTSFECDLALAGGVTIGVPQISGYRFQEGGILSPDGHCRAFDAKARGTSPGSGAGAVILKRYADAITDGDAIYALVLGSAVNNDGASKVGFTAPSISGQAEVIAAAQALAGVEPRSITYVEAHGTGTPLGDPIEVEALTQVFREGTPERGFCGLGSIKSNFGHLDAAAGVAGFLKASLALRHRLLPPSLHFTTPNPAIDFAASPFYVVDRATPWQSPDTPRRAAVSSFGIGGTNAHAILEEAPEPAPTAPGKGAELLLLAARSAPALDAARARLAAHLEAEPGLSLPDIAHTLAVGRRAFRHRAAFAATDLDGVRKALTGELAPAVPSGEAPERAPEVVFLFPGQGAQRLGMAAGLYRGEEVFRAAVDRAASLLAPELGLNLAELLDPTPERAGAAEAALATTRFTQPALFVVEHALAELLGSWGLEPAVMLGHSIGEYVAAYRAGLWSLDDALRLVAARGRLMESLPPGAMLSVPLQTEELLPLLSSDLAIAADNAPRLKTVAGTKEEIARLEALLGARGVQCKRLHTARAFHSPACDAVLPAFREVLRQVRFRSPTRSWLSNLTGTWITEAEAADPATWVAHLRSTVRFSAGLTALTGEVPRLFLEVGPGKSLTTLVRQHPELAGAAAIPCLPEAGRPEDDRAQLLHAYGRAWVSGAELPVEKLWAGEVRRRLHLPTYPFEHRRYWVEPAGTAPRQIAAAAAEPAAVAAVPGRHPRPALTTAFAPPAGALEERIAALMSELLGIAPVGRHDDFFEAGGSSLLAVSLSAELEARHGLTLDPATLASGATAATLAARLAASNGARTTSCLVELSSTGDPLVLVHPIGGGILAYTELARLLTPDTRLLALRALGSEAGEEPRASIPEMALAYCELLLAALPQGPYRLGGWSFGGLLAFEMARELTRRGREVALLALLDALPPAAGGVPLPHDESRLRAWFERDASALGTADSARERRERLWRVFRANALALAEYRPAPARLGSEVVLFAAAHETPSEGSSGPPPADAARRWSELCGTSVDVELLAAHHYTLLTPPAVRHLARALGARSATGVFRP